MSTKTVYNSGVIQACSGVILENTCSDIEKFRFMMIIERNYYFGKLILKVFRQIDKHYSYFRVAVYFSVVRYSVNDTGWVTTTLIWYVGQIRSNTWQNIKLIVTEIERSYRSVDSYFLTLSGLPSKRRQHNPENIFRKPAT